MATYTTVRNGSKGSAVSDLQQRLNTQGYNLAVDGIFGRNTLAAVQDYQGKHNLSVDGIVGANTWGSLYGSDASGSGTSANAVAPGSTTKTSSEWLSQYESSAPEEYKPSQAVTDAADVLAGKEASTPDPYNSRYADQIDAKLDQILNRDGFTYDFSADPMYQQYAQRYQQQGRMAMQDTMGQAAALSGGYGNSYAQVAGQQAYQQYLQGLNDVIPDLRDAAYQQYQDQGDQMRTDLSTLQGQDDADYGRYRDGVSDYYNDLDYYYSKHRDMSQDDYNRYKDNISQWQAERSYWYSRSQDDAAAADAASNVASSSGGKRKPSVDKPDSDQPTGGEISNAIKSLYGDDNVDYINVDGQWMTEAEVRSGLSNGSLYRQYNSTGNYQVKNK